jgi:hypothetical protein
MGVLAHDTVDSSAGLANSVGFEAFAELVAAIAVWSSRSFTISVFKAIIHNDKRLEVQDVALQIGIVTGQNRLSLKRNRWQRESVAFELFKV